MDARDTYKADEGRFLYYLYATKARMVTPAVLGARIKAYGIAQNYYAKELADPRIAKFVVDAAADRTIANHYTGSTVSGVGVRMGAYSVAHSDGAVPLLATDWLKDCNALVLVGQDPKDPARKTVMLAHIDVVTDVAREVPKLLQQMPKDSTVTATMLGGPDNENFYMETDILRALKADKRVKKIRVNTEDAATVLVDVASGHIFTSTRNTAKKSYEIGPKTFPLATDIAFYPPQPEGLASVREIEWQMLYKRDHPMAPYVRTATLLQVNADGHTPKEQAPTLQAAKGALDMVSMQLAKQVSMPVALAYDTTPHDSSFAPLPLPAATRVAQR